MPLHPGQHTPFRNRTSSLLFSASRGFFEIFVNPSGLVQTSHLLRCTSLKEHHIFPGLAVLEFLEITGQYSRLPGKAIRTSAGESVCCSSLRPSVRKHYYEQVRDESTNCEKNDADESKKMMDLEFHKPEKDTGGRLQIRFQKLTLLVKVFGL